MKSCIYRGSISHTRRGNARNSFSYSLYMLWLDLAELDQVFVPFWLWSARKPALARFRRSNHFGDPSLPLDQCIRDLVGNRTGERPTGPIRLLTHLSYFGYCFNPLSVYYCYDDNEHLQTIVLEVSNTPWNEQHCYVLSADNRQNEHHHYSFPKEFHVSPFLPMDMHYSCRLVQPEERLYLALDNHRDGAKVFGTHLTLDREAINHRNMAIALVANPMMTLKISALIHWQALRLWLKRAPYYPHRPHTQQNDSTSKESGIAHHG